MPQEMKSELETALTLIAALLKSNKKKFSKQEYTDIMVQLESLRAQVKDRTCVPAVAWKYEVADDQDLKAGDLVMITDEKNPAAGHQIEWRTEDDEYKGQIAEIRDYDRIHHCYELDISPKYFLKKWLIKVKRVSV